jgi:hypothetical protein
MSEMTNFDGKRFFLDFCNPRGCFFRLGNETRHSVAIDAGAMPSIFRQFECWRIEKGGSFYGSVIAKLT